MPRYLLKGIVFLGIAACFTRLSFAGDLADTKHVTIEHDVVASGLNHPWSFAFLPDGSILVTERSGELRIVHSDGRLEPKPISGLPPIQEHGQGGLLDIALHPEFEQNQRLCLSFAEPGNDGFGTSVICGHLHNRIFQNAKIVFQMKKKSDSPYHFGSRLVFDNDGHLFITLGDRGKRSRAQKLDDHAGSLIRIHDDGSIPNDNPFIKDDKALPEIYSYGHRNMQGAALHPVTGQIWAHEHGPQGGDELNIPLLGKNYGWPVVTYGVNYVIGTKIGEGTYKTGMEQPVHYWVPSIAPSGMAFYTGNAIPQWKGNLFIGSLKFKQLVRLVLDGERVIHEERLFTKQFGRIRDVRQGPDGLLYLLTDDDNGRIIRLHPAVD